MSRIPKWKAEKAKVKVVFRLQFHATHVPQPGWDKLFISFVPADTGKATAKTTKANVRNGNCKWSDPIYETTRLLQDARSRIYDDKLYRLVVAMGSSRSGILGEVMINLADFADASKPSAISLPLQSCDHGTVLHVTVQLLTSKTGFREFEQQRELSVKGFQASSSPKVNDSVETGTTSLETAKEQIARVNNARVRFKEESSDLPSLEEAGESHEDYEDSAAGIDGSSNTSESLYAEKNEISSIHEVETLKSMITGDVCAVPAGQSPISVKGDLHDNRLTMQGSNDWTHGWSSDYSADNDLATTYEENNRLRERLEGVESAFMKLKTEAKSLQSLTDELGAETESLAKQLSTELASGEKLTRDVSILKSECYKFKTELDKLKSATAMQSVPGKKTPNYVTAKGKVEDAMSTGQDNHFNHVQVKWLQGLLLLEDKVRQLQDRACPGFCGSDFDFLSSDFDVLHSILRNLKQETSIELVEEAKFTEIQVMGGLQSEYFAHGEGLERSYMDDHHTKVILNCSSNPHPLETNITASSVLEEKMYELLQKLEESTTEKGILTKKMDQMERYYETLIQELEEARHQTVNEIENLRTEHSSCIYTISTLQDQIEKLQHDMNQQLMKFSGDKHELDSLNKELEKRAIASETALKTVRWNYAIAVDRLQKDLELLSYQVLSMYKTNENLVKQAILDASQLSSHQYPATDSESQYKAGQESISMETDLGLPNGVSAQASFGTVCNSDFIKENEIGFQRGLPRNVDMWIKDEKNTRINGWKSESIEATTPFRCMQEDKNMAFHSDLSSPAQRNDEHWENSPVFEPKCDSQNQSAELDNQLLGTAIGSEESGKSLSMMQELHISTEAELSELHTLNVHFEVFTQVLKETLCSVKHGVTNMKEAMDTLTEQLEHAAVDNESLMLRLQSSVDEARNLRENDAKCKSQCDDLMMKNYFLEVKVQDITAENSSLSQKFAEYERILTEFSVYENKYKSCFEERNEFEEMLKYESVQKGCLQNELSSVVEDFSTLKKELDRQYSSNSELQQNLSFLQKQLQDLSCRIVLIDEEINGSTVDDLPPVQELASNDYMGIVLQLENFQQRAYKKIIQLRQEKKEIENQRNIADCSLNKTESQFLHLKQKFESDLEEITMKLDSSNALVEKLKLELEHLSEKFKCSLESEEIQRKENRELSSKLIILETEIQQVNEENRVLAQKMLEFHDIREEFEKTKLHLTDCMQENRALIMSVESGKLESVQLEKELSSLKEGLESIHDNLHTERRLREDLEATVADHKLQLKEKCHQLLSCDEQKSELIFLRQRIIDLEAEMQHVLLHTEESKRKLCEDISSLRIQIADLEYYLAETFDHLLSSDVKIDYMRCQFQLKMEEILDQAKAVQGELEYLHLKHVNVVTSLDEHIDVAAQYADENKKMSIDLQSVQAELEIVVREKERLLVEMDEMKSVLADVEDMRARSMIVEADNRREKFKLEDEICQLRKLLVILEEEVENLRSSEVELEMTEIILKSKLDEQQTAVSMVEEYKPQLEMLREQHGELTHKLSEQILKAEEFKNLSIYLRELKDKAEFECLQARERRESEGSAIAMQDSLRIAFIKEQCESKLQEMKNQLCASNKYAEEMLLKLQTALDEIESGKKTEASLAKRNEELSLKISDMEGELQTITSDRRELVKAYDRMKAELECTVLSLECCKEEKLKLETSLQEFNEERKRLRIELDLVKRLLASSATDVETLKHQPDCQRSMSIGKLIEHGKSQFSAEPHETSRVLSCCADGGSVTTVAEDPVIDADRENLLDMTPVFSGRGMQHTSAACGTESSTSPQPSMLDLQEEHVIRLTVEETSLSNSMTNIADIKEHFKEQQRLLTRMELLHKELEKLKADNLTSIIPLEDNLEPAHEVLQNDLSQLDKANEQLGSIFPLFKEFHGSGNALKKVLALELELAESLQAKKSTSIRFQSSFLKQHNDDEAVFRSFRDINDLIKDMLELKRRNAAVEKELKDMQGRYSQLSLQFAEVEGERQQLVMTLKNRSPRKALESQFLR